MPNPVAHFEIYGDNPTKLAGFYQGLFGWQINKSQGMDHWIVRTVQTDAKGAPPKDSARKSSGRSLLFQRWDGSRFSRIPSRMPSRSGRMIPTPSEAPVLPGHGAVC